MQFHEKKNEIYYISVLKYFIYLHDINQIVGFDKNFRYSNRYCYELMIKNG